MVSPCSFSSISSISSFSFFSVPEKSALGWLLNQLLPGKYLTLTLFYRGQP